MDATEESVDVYYGKVLYFIEIEVPECSRVCDRTTYDCRYKIAVIKWSSGLKVGRQGQIYKEGSRELAFGSTTVEDDSIIGPLIGLVEHEVPSRSTTAPSRRR